MKKYIKKKKKKKNDCLVGCFSFFFELLYFKKVDNKLANGVELEDIACVKRIKIFLNYYSLLLLLVVLLLFSSE
jgi:hypothetical protein